MTLLRDWQFDLNADHILRAQGADPVAIRSRKPRLVEIAERALVDGLPLIEPAVVYRQFKVKSVQHERILLAEDGVLAGKLIASQLAPAKHIVVMICTIGDALERFSLETMNDDPAYGFALYGLGSAAVEMLATRACRYFGGQAKTRGWESTVPLSPGMEGWPADQGQAQIFKLIDGREAGVTLSAGGMMYPRKSLSQVIGLGEDVDANARVCDFCAQRYTCRYQDQYAHS
jgi:hypothetical protein